MAESIRGINVVIGAETTGLQRALADVTRNARNIQQELRQVERLLRMDPGNTTLLAQQQQLLGNAIENTRDKLARLRAAQEQVNQQFARGEISEGQYRAFQREVAQTEQELERLERQLEQTGRASQTLATRMAAVGTTLQDVGRRMTAVGQQLTMAVTMPILAVGAASFKMAADLQDAMGAADQIFKDASGSVQEWASGLESYYGIAESEALTYANTMGAMLQNIGGLSQQAAAEQAQILVELAGDLTAMFGGTTESAVQALTGALKGNNSMLDNYGMGVNEATIKSKALEMGLIQEGEQLDLAGKQAATLALIMEQTADAQGQAARESEGASGALRSFTTELKNVGTDIGEVLLPILTPMVLKLKEAVQAFGQLSPGTQTAIIAIAAVAAAIGPLLIVVGMLVSSVGTIMTAFAAASAAIAAISAPVLATIAVAGVLIGVFVAMVAAVVNFVASNEEAQTKIGIIWSKIVQLVRPPFDALKAFWEKWGDEISTYFDAVWAAIGIIWETALLNIMDIVIFFLDVLTGDWEGAGQALQDIWSRTWAAIKDILSRAWGLLMPAFTSLYTSIQSWFTDLFTSALQWGQNIVNNIADGIRAGIGRVGDAMSAVANTVSAYMPFSPAKEGALRDIMDFGPNITRMIADGIERGLPSLYDSMDQLSLVVAAPLTGSSPAAAGVSSGVSGPTAVRADRLAPTINQTVIVNSPAPMSAADIARKTRQVSRQLALEWQV